MLFFPIRIHARCLFCFFFIFFLVYTTHTHSPLPTVEFNLQLLRVVCPIDRLCSSRFLRNILPRSSDNAGLVVVQSSISIIPTTAAEENYRFSIGSRTPRREKKSIATALDSKQKKKKPVITNALCLTRLCTNWSSTKNLEDRQSIGNSEPAAVTVPSTATRLRNREIRVCAVMGHVTGLSETIIPIRI